MFSVTCYDVDALTITPSCADSSKELGSHRMLHMLRTQEVQFYNKMLYLPAFGEIKFIIL